MKKLKFWFKTRSMTDEQRENVRLGLPLDFELPYPYPRNDHEEGMNWVAVNGVVSARADWYDKA